MRDQRMGVAIEVLVGGVLLCDIIFCGQWVSRELVSGYHCFCRVDRVC